MVTIKLNHWELRSTTNLKTVIIKQNTIAFYTSTREESGGYSETPRKYNLGYSFIR